MMKKLLSFQEIVEQYIETGIVLTETISSGNYRKGNRISKINRKCFEILKQDKALAEKVLLKVMACDIDKSRSIAAADLLRLNIAIDEAIKVLKDVSKREDMIGFGAEIALKNWIEEEKGKTL